MWLSTECVGDPRKRFKPSNLAVRVRVPAGATLAAYFPEDLFFSSLRFCTLARSVVSVYQEKTRAASLERLNPTLGLPTHSAYSHRRIYLAAKELIA